MYFYEVIEKCNLEEVVKEFLSFCNDSPDISVTEKGIRNVIEKLNEIEAITSNTNILFIEKVETEVETFEAISLFDTVKKEIYSIEVNPWAETLGYIVDEKSLSVYGKERFMALVLWEMTWFGYDENSIQEVVKSWDEEC